MQPYDELLRHFKEYRLLDSIGAIARLGPAHLHAAQGSEHRAEQMALLAKLGHAKMTSPRIGELIDVDGSPCSKRPTT